MSNYEICSKVRRNGGGKVYLRILSELNACPVTAIERILKENNFVKVSGVWKYKSSLNTVNSSVETKAVENVIIIKDKGEDEMAAGIKLTDAQKQDILRDYLDTYDKYIDIARRHDVSEWSVGKVVREYNSGDLKLTKAVKTKAKPVKAAPVKAKVASVKSDADVIVPVNALTVSLEGVSPEVLSDLYRSVKTNLENKQKEILGLQQLKAFLEGVGCK